MSNENQVEGVAVVPVAQVVKQATKKAVKKAVAKKVVKKVAPKATEKVVKKTGGKQEAASEPRAKKDGLRKGQERILKLLAKSSKPLTRALISEKAPVDVAACTEYLGSSNDEKRLENDVKHFPSLVSLKYIKAEVQEEGGTVYIATASGKAAAAKLD